MRLALLASLWCVALPGWTQTQSPTPPPAESPTVPTPVPVIVAAPEETPFARGIAAYKSENLPAALREMRDAVKDNPRDAGAWRWLGFLLVQDKKPDESVAPLRRALALLEEARRVPSNSEAVKSDMADAHSHLGDALLMLGGKADILNAVESFRKSAQIAPTTLAFYNLGFAYTRAGRYDDSARAYRKSIALAPKGERTWRTWSGLGFALQKQGREKYAEAAEAYRESANLKRDDATLWVSLGTLQMERGASFRISAITALETARKLNGQNYPAVVTLARAYAEGDRLEEAANLFAEAAALPEANNPQTQAMLLYNRGVVLARSKKLSDAQGAYERALGLKPQYFDALVNLGFVLFEQRKVDDAIARFRQSLAVQSNSYLAWSNLGAAYLQKKDLPNATTAWRKAAQIQPQNYDARAVLADLLLQQERTDEAIAVYRQMAVLMPQSALPMNSLGLAYQKKGDANGAFSAFREAVRREPRNAAARNNLGVLYEKRNDLVAAIAEYKSALLLDPGFADAKANLVRFGAQAAPVRASIAPPNSSRSAAPAPDVPKLGKKP